MYKASLNLSEPLSAMAKKDLLGALTCLSTEGTTDNAQEWFFSSLISYVESTFSGSDLAFARNGAETLREFCIDIALGQGTCELEKLLKVLNSTDDVDVIVLCLRVAQAAVEDRDFILDTNDESVNANVLEFVAQVTLSDE